ncbi:MAG: hypothetical protein UR82_C0093G0003 [Candidatus Moranbacteria bacterium GW2011_GWF1_35_5]|nr:MAG: hypothetical protein UR82_C0093G0003 [Candidatus Moranbacteria bacterium GW2011_GWF1_35_5]
MLRFRVIYKNINFTKFLRLIENGGEIMFTNKNNVGLKISFIIMLIATIVGFEKFIYPSLFNDKSPKTHAIEIGWTINNSSNISGYELYLNGKKVCAWRDWEKATLENTASIVSIEMDGTKSMHSHPAYIATYNGKVISKGIVPDTSQPKTEEEIPTSKKDRVFSI